MDNIETRVKKILGSDAERDLPAEEVSVEKKERGLYERTRECRVLLTEDNKQLLND